MNIVFVILHYLDLESTLDTVKYIDNQICNKNMNVSLLIVDNNSNNESGIYLRNLFKNRLDIKVIINKENLGFAKGNNIGYSFAKSNLDPDLIIVMNNDVFIKDERFLIKLAKIDLTNIHIIGPNIITKDGIYQNPFRVDKISKKTALKIHTYNLLIYTLFNIPVLNKIVLSVLNTKNESKNKSSEKPNIDHFNVVLHGSVLIYTYNWIKNEDFAFLPETFMYMEEDILYEYINKKSYSTMFSNELSVVHMEDAATNKLNSDLLQKRKFISGEMIKSSKILLKMMR